MNSKEKVSYLVLDYNRPQHSYQCLTAIKEKSLFEHQVIFLSNGGEQEYCFDFYRLGLIDRLILRKENGGLGIGTLELFRYCDTKYAIYCQNDQLLMHPMRQEDIDNWISVMRSNQNVKMIGLAGPVCGENIYSERAHICDVEFYNSIPKKPIGGAGPYHQLPWIEGYIQKYLKDNGYLFPCVTPPPFVDMGLLSVRQNPDGSIWAHRTDTKEVWHVAGEVVEKFVHPPFDDAEFEDAKAGRWPVYGKDKAGRIPKAWEQLSFRAAD